MAASFISKVKWKYVAFVNGELCVDYDRYDGLGYGDSRIIPRKMSYRPAAASKPLVYHEFDR